MSERSQEEARESREHAVHSLLNGGERVAKGRQRRSADDE